MQKIKKFLFQNTSTKQTIAKNTFWLIAGEGVSRLMKMVLVIYAARILGKEGWGIFSYALSLVGIFMTFSDAGISTLMTKNLSKNFDNDGDYISTAFHFKSIILLVSFFSILIFAPMVNHVPGAEKIILALAVFTISDSMREFLFAINRATERMQYEGISKIITNLSIAIIGIWLLTEYPTPKSLALAYLIGSVIGTISIIWIIKPIVKKIKKRFSKTLFRNMWSSLWPIIIVSLFSTILFNLDTFMLGFYRGAIDIGLYSVAQKLVQFTYILPGIIGLTILPTLSKTAYTEKKKVFAQTKKVASVLFYVSIPICLAGLLFSRYAITLIFGNEYINSALSASIMFITVLSVFPNFIFIQTIFALDIQKSFIKPIIYSAVLNVILNLLLIPTYGIVGASIAITISQCTVAILHWSKLINYFQKT